MRVYFLKKAEIRAKIPNSPRYVGKVLAFIYVPIKKPDSCGRVRSRDRGQNGDKPSCCEETCKMCAKHERMRLSLTR